MTDKGSSKFLGVSTSTFPCSSLFSSTTINFAAWKCQWTSNSTTTAYPVGFPSAGTVVSLKSGTLKTACMSGTLCSNYLYASGNPVNISFPNDPLAPVAALSSFLTNSMCDDTTLDPTASFGKIAPLWLGIEWSVSAADDDIIIPTSALDLLSAYLNYNVKDTGSLVTIPRSYLVPGTYIFSLRVMNFFMLVSMASVTVTVQQQQQQQPQVRIAGPTSFSLFARQPLSIVAIPLWPRCDSGKGTVYSNANASQILLSWSVFQGLNLVASLQTSSADPRLFTLRPYSLQPYQTYIIQVSLTVADPNSFQSNHQNEGFVAPLASSTVSVFVASSGVAASIFGGSLRTISYLNTLYLDASLSYDIDDPSATLSYAWTCMLILPTYGQPCPFLGPRNGTLTVSIVSVAPKKMIPGNSYKFTVFVSNERGQSAAATTTVSAIKPSLPLVMVGTPLVKYDPSKIVVLSGSVAGINATVSTWSSANFSTTSLNRLSLTGTAQQVASAGIATIQLSLPPYTFSPGLTYSFTLVSSYGVGAAATVAAQASVVIIMNRPPMGGVLTASPKKGTALQTSFLLQASNWVDEASDFPLTYSFFSMAVSSSASYLLQPVNPLPYTSTLLGPGLKSQGFAVSCIVVVTDLYNCSANTSVVVTVAPLSSTANVFNIISSAVTSAQVTADSTTVTQVISAGLAIINAVDCYVSKPCGSLFRQECSTTSRTCGPCFPGYVGVDGDSNSPCIPLTDSLPERRRLSLQPSLRRDSQTCQTNSSCYSGRCINRQCTVTAKQCPNSCSRAGSCVYSDFNGAVVPFCAAANPNCFASCQCNANRYSRDCSLSSFGSFSQAVQVREQLCLTLFSLLNIQNLNADVLANRASTIAGLFLDMSEVTDAAFTNCSHVLVVSVLSDPVLACTSTAAAQVIAALSTALSRNNVPKGLFTDLTQALLTMSFACSSTLVHGQSPFLLIADRIRSSINRIDYRSPTGSITISGPQTSFEQFQVSTAASITVSSSSSSLKIVSQASATNPLKLSLVQFKIDPGVEDHSSPSTFLLWSSQPSIATPATLSTDYSAVIAQAAAPTSLKTSALTDVTVVLPTISPMSYAAIGPSTQVYQCPDPRRNTTAGLATVTVSCPSGSQYTITCPGDKQGFFTYTCAAYRSYPVCTLWNGTAYAATTNCVVTQFSSLNTTCYCEGLTTTGIIGFSTRTAVSTSLPFVEFVELRVDLVARDFVIVFVILGFVLILTVGVVYFFIVDFMRPKHAPVYATASRSDKYLDNSATDSTALPRTIAGYFDDILPQDFSVDRWFNIWGRRLWTEHSWLRLIAHRESNRTGDVGVRLYHWLRSLGRILSILFVTTIVIISVYPNDGVCENMTDEQNCIAHRISIFTDDSCVWSQLRHSCSFIPPAVDSTALVLLTIVITVLAVPISKSIEYLTYFSIDDPDPSHKADQSAVSHALPSKPAQAQHLDEFRQVQTIRATILRAVRLEKMKKTIDFILPHEEVSILMLLASLDSKRVKNWMVFTNTREKSSLDQLRYRFVPQRGKLVRSVEAARKSADEISCQLNGMSSDIEKESFLIKCFVADYCAIRGGSFIRRHVLGQVKWVQYGRFRRLRRAVCLFFSPIFFCGLLAAIFEISKNSVGAKTTKIWLSTAGVAIFADVVVVQAIQVWMRWVVVTATVGPDVRELFLQLKLRSRLILMRSRGLLKFSNALIQHFNPACRAARLFPSLPVARLLMSLGDYDFPNYDKSSSSSSIGSDSQRGYSYFNAWILTSSLLPDEMQDTFLEVLIAISCGAVALALNYVAVLSLYGAVVSLVFIVALPAAYEFGSFALDRYLKYRRDEKLKIQQFYELEKDFDEELDRPVDDMQNDAFVGKNSKIKPMSSNLKPANDEESKDSDLNIRVDQNQNKNHLQHQQYSVDFTAHPSHFGSTDSMHRGSSHMGASLLMYQQGFNASYTSHDHLLGGENINLPNSSFASNSKPDRFQDDHHDHHDHRRDMLRSLPPVVAPLSAPHKMSASARSSNRRGPGYSQSINNFNSMTSPSEIITSVVQNNSISSVDYHTMRFSSGPRDVSAFSIMQSVHTIHEQNSSIERTPDPRERQRYQRNLERSRRQRDYIEDCEGHLYEGDETINSKGYELELVQSEFQSYPNEKPDKLTQQFPSFREDFASSHQAGKGYIAAGEEPHGIDQRLVQRQGQGQELGQGQGQENVDDDFFEDGLEGQPSLVRIAASIGSLDDESDIFFDDGGDFDFTAAAWDESHGMNEVQRHSTRPNSAKRPQSASQRPFSAASDRQRPYSAAGQRPDSAQRPASAVRRGDERANQPVQQQRRQRPVSAADRQSHHSRDVDAPMHRQRPRSAAASAATHSSPSSRPSPAAAAVGDHHEYADVNDGECTAQDTLGREYDVGSPQAFHDGVSTRDHTSQRSSDRPISATAFYRTADRNVVGGTVNGMDRIDSHDAHLDIDYTGSRRRRRKPPSASLASSSRGHIQVGPGAHSESLTHSQIHTGLLSGTFSTLFESTAIDLMDPNLDFDVSHIDLKDVPLTADEVAARLGKSRPSKRTMKAPTGPGRAAKELSVKMTDSEHPMLL